jgi:hypothetical protein
MSLKKIIEIENNDLGEEEIYKFLKTIAVVKNLNIEISCI